MGRPKSRGRYCWSCDQRRANEKFSGKGHARCLCRDCQKLGPAELAYRQALRDLDRCVTLEGIVPRKRRKQFAEFLNHSAPRIRQLAREIHEDDQAARDFLRMCEGERPEPPENDAIDLDTLPCPPEPWQATEALRQFNDVAEGDPGFDDFFHEFVEDFVDSEQASEVEFPFDPTTMNDIPY